MAFWTKQLYGFDHALVLNKFVFESFQDFEAFWKS
jgi:hypothetical protein